MKLLVKTLKGGKFTVEAEPSSTVAEVKSVIEGSNSELPAVSMKLIHSGKVLKDDVTIETCNIKPNDFLVCMITKSKAKKAAPAPAAPAPAPVSMEISTPASTTPAAAPATSTPASTAPVTDEFPAEVISNLTGMGFPLDSVNACLRAAQGNPDVAVEFLTNGIPPTATPTPGTAPTGSSDAPLAALRTHPQFDALRRLVQSNPSTLQAVLTQIGQQQPELLQEINGNQAEFIRMMNEPITDTPAATTPAPSTNTTTPSAPTRPGNASLTNPLGANPAQMAQMISSLSPTELSEMSNMMGISAEQLTSMATMMSSLGSNSQFEEYMSQAMNQNASPHILRLSEEEMAAVDRLTEMGFDRSEAAQAFLACDKNEALAANLLMDSAGDGGFGGPPAGNGGNDDSEDMYE